VELQPQINRNTRFCFLLQNEPADESGKDFRGSHMTTGILLQTFLLSRDQMDSQRQHMPVNIWTRISEVQRLFGLLAYMIR